jgi:exonuclease VII large subunit
MNSAATKEDVQEAVKGVTEELSSIIRDFAQQVDERFNGLERSAKKAEDNYARLLDTLDHFLKRLDDSESNDAARDTQFERLLTWARKVSEKTGIPLENL